MRSSAKSAQLFSRNSDLNLGNKQSFGAFYFINYTVFSVSKGQSSLTTKNGLKIWKNKNIRKPVVFVVLIIFNLSSLQNAILFMKNCIL
jgi:hypothetical protein